MANLPWFKIHNEFLTDPKLRRYFTKSERCDWINLLCLANTSKERGVVVIPADEIAYALDLLDEEWEALCEKLVLRRMVEIRNDDGAVVIINWEERQYDKPSDRPEATAERQRNSRANRANTTSAPLSRPVTPQRRGEEIRVE